ncbi:MAG: DNA polymerase III subunit gamma/tau, partial [Alphaproteobacteria bacterium]|nr:DNA polymerase III subunit gamma/tau [Alphaproteobacteria bacterium]
MTADSDDQMSDDAPDDVRSGEGSPTIDDVNQSSFLDGPSSAPAPEPEPEPEPIDATETPAPPPAESATPAVTLESDPATGDYVVLARKYRPQNFDELIGQESLVQTLTNAFKLDRVAHAFILTGVRGVGKTTTARIIAKCLNATDGPTITPAADDEQCVAIAQDRHPDVIEVDAASRTGVDDIREILDGVRYRPVFGRYKVYIIDEVHMLSRNAFNALLKTLEEPPEHVKFIFATTEIRKVPVTVLSRCQRFDLRRVGADELLEHFTGIVTKESAVVDEDALRLIARAADGSVRDGLSLLDQAIAAYGSGGATASEAQVRAMLGVADASGVYDLFEAVMGGRADDALSGLRTLYDSGADPIAILQDLLGLSHWLTRVKLVPKTADDATVSEVERVRGKELAEKLPVSVLSRAWQILLKGLGEAQRAPMAMPAVEMVLIRLAYAADLPAPADIVARLEADGGKPATATVATQAPTSPPAETNGDATAVSSAPMSTSDNAAPSGAAPQATMAAVAPELAPELEPELEPALQPTETVEPDPATFRELIELFAARREIQLRNHLYTNVHLIAYEPGRLEFRPNDLAPGNLAGEVLNFLREWRGAHWSVSVSGEVGEPTLAEQDSAHEQAERTAAAQDPVVRAALETFTGARIERVVSRE